MTVTCPHSVTAGSYLLGVLHPSELEEYRRHAGSCPHCEREIADLTPVARFLKVFKAEIEAGEEVDVSLLLGHIRPRQSPPEESVRD
ncbi:hypothetical protein [Actinocrispum sp. NPDC049592]|uniref:hypothetical protein n=1 Tax=Actinocrispum sp. NPDC049592 TaxID=3154835 RepID=UPI00344914FE